MKVESKFIKQVKEEKDQVFNVGDLVMYDHNRFSGLGPFIVLVTYEELLSDGEFSGVVVWADDKQYKVGYSCTNWWARKFSLCPVGSEIILKVLG